MKLIICIVNNRDKSKLGEALLQDGFEHTVLNSVGGFLKQGNTIYLIGIDEKRIPHLYDLIKDNCQAREEVINPVPMGGSLAGTFIQSPMTVRIGGATVFVLDVEQFDRL